MSEIILWSLLAFFSAFGIVEFVRFVYTDWNSGQNDFYVIIPADGIGENLEAVVRNALIATGAHPIIIISNNADEEEAYILKRLEQKYEYISVLRTEEYIDLLKK